MGLGGQATMATIKLQTTDRADKRDLILRAAIQQFNERGFNDTRLEDVAAVLETSKTSISYHFKSKQALLEQAYEATCAIHSDLINRAGAGDTGKEKLLRWVTGLGEMHSAVLAGRADNIAFLNDLSVLERDIAARIAGLCGENYAKLSEFFEEGLKDGSIEKSTPDGSVYFLWNVASWIESWLGALPVLKHEVALKALISRFELGLVGDCDTRLEAGIQQNMTDPSSALFDREARARLKKHAFERAGIRSFNRFGYANISLNALAKNLGASRGSFYYTFADKDALLESCAHRSLRQFSVALDSAESTSFASAQRLYHACTSLYSGHFSDLDPLLRPSLFSSLPPRMRAVAQAEMQSIAARFARLVADSIDDDVEHSEGEERLDLVLLASLNTIAATRTLVDPRDHQPVPIPSSQAYFHVLFKGLGSNRI